MIDLADESTMGVGATAQGRVIYNNTTKTLRVSANGVAFVDVGANVTFVFAAKTGNYGVLATDSGTMFSNAGAVGEVDFTLPTGVAGMVFNFVVEAAQTLKVVATNNATIRLAGVASAANGNVTNATVGGTLCLLATSATTWVALWFAGSAAWTVT